jgi:hypothetical protein
MKARIATVLSLTGVLVAGSAAALVNTQVLQSAAERDTTVSAITIDARRTESVSTESTTVGASVESVPESLPNKLQDVAAVAVTSASTPASTLQEFTIGVSGNVVLDTANGVLTVAGITPAAGWGVIEHSNIDPLNIAVKFQSADTLIEAKANLLMGVVSWDIEAYALTQPTTGNTTSGSTGTSPSNTGGTAKPSTSAPTTSDHDTSTSVDDHDDDDGSHGGNGGGGGGGDDD